MRIWVYGDNDCNYICYYWVSVSCCGDRYLVKKFEDYGGRRCSKHNDYYMPYDHYEMFILCA